MPKEKAMNRNQGPEIISSHEHFLFHTAWCGGSQNSRFHIVLPFILFPVGSPPLPLPLEFNLVRCQYLVMGWGREEAWFEPEVGLCEREGKESGRKCVKMRRGEGMQGQLMAAAWEDRPNTMQQLCCTSLPSSALRRQRLNFLAFTLLFWATTSKRSFLRGHKPIFHLLQGETETWWLDLSLLTLVPRNKPVVVKKWPLVFCFNSKKNHIRVKSGSDLEPHNRVKFKMIVRFIFLRN